MIARNIVLFLETACPQAVGERHQDASIFEGCESASFSQEGNVDLDALPWKPK